MDQCILSRRLHHISQNTLSGDYKNKVNEVLSILDSSEQDVRIGGLHKYLDENVMPKLVDS